MGIQTALIGFGHLGKWHGEKSEKIETCDFVAVVDPSEKALNLAKEKFPEIETFKSFKECLNRFPDLQAVIVVSPTSYHFEICKEALLHELHVFCEKPLCETIPQGEELKHLRSKNPNLKFQVGHSERCHEAWELIKSNPILKESNLIVRINRYAPFKGRATDVDVVQDLMVHDLDLIFLLLGENPNSVFAMGKKIRTTKWDHVTAELDFPSGHHGIITVGRNHVEERREVEIIGEQGTLHVNLFENKISFASGSESDEEKYVESQIYEKRDHLLLEQEYFFNSILKNESEFVTIDEGVQAVRLIHNVLESLEREERILL